MKRITRMHVLFSLAALFTALALVAYPQKFTALAETVAQWLEKGHYISNNTALTATKGRVPVGDGTAYAESPLPNSSDAAADVIWGPSAANHKAFVLQGKASQSVNVFEIQNSAGIAQFAISLGSATVTGPNNTNLGVNAGSSMTLGSNNTLVGVNAGTLETSGAWNTMVGSLAGGTTQSSGSGNVIIGYSSDTNAAGDSNAVIIGKSTVGAGSSVIIGNTLTSSTANDLIVRSGDTGIARKAAGRLQCSDGSGNSTGDIVPNARAINYLINGGFDVNQRVPDSPATNISGIVLGTDKYSADRWKVSAANADVAFSRSDTQASRESGLNARSYGVYTKHTNAGKVMVYQVLESRNTLPLTARAVTVQFKIKSSASATFRVGLIYSTIPATVDASITTLVPTTWGAASTDPTLQTNYAYVAPTRIPAGLSGSIVGNAVNCVTATNWQLFGASFTVPTASSNPLNLIVAIWSDSNMAVNDTVSISEAALYDGAAVRDWVPPLYQEEVARCERYYWKLGTQDGFSPFFDYHPAYNTTAVMGRVHFPVVMRIPPAMTTGGSLRIEDGVTVFTAGLVATDYGNGNTNEGHNINVAVTGPITQFRTYRFSANNDTTAYVAFDADF